MPGLVHLDLSSNRLSSVAPVGDLRLLAVLVAPGNLLTDAGAPLFVWSGVGILMVVPAMGLRLDRAWLITAPPSSLPSLFALLALLTRCGSLAKIVLSNNQLQVSDPFSRTLLSSHLQCREVTTTHKCLSHSDTRAHAISHWRG